MNSVKFSVRLQYPLIINFTETSARETEWSWSTTPSSASRSTFHRLEAPPQAPRGGNGSWVRSTLSAARLSTSEPCRISSTTTMRCRPLSAPPVRSTRWCHTKRSQRRPTGFPPPGSPRRPPCRPASLPPGAALCAREDPSVRRRRSVRSVPTNRTSSTSPVGSSRTEQQSFIQLICDTHGKFFWLHFNGSVHRNWFKQLAHIIIQPTMGTFGSRSEKTFFVIATTKK